MPVIHEISEGRFPVKIFTDDVDDGALSQLVSVSNLPILYGHVAAMPDVHAGIGAAVGSVIPTRNAVIPAAVGVDIGCGMIAVQLSLRAEDLPDSLKAVRSSIESAVPVGFERHKTVQAPKNSLTRLAPTLEKILEKHPPVGKRLKKLKNAWMLQLGTLGGGNHFIELCLDETDRLWVMLHSGSRGIGNAIGRYFIELAKKDMGVHIKNLPDRNLAYLNAGTEHFNDYLEAVEWAQEYARENRQIMLELVLNAMRRCLPEFSLSKMAINCHHNYVTREHHFGEDIFVTRKGAIRAGKGELGIIPGSMGAASYIVCGKGNPESLDSCAHGAGRKMSRTEAKNKFTIKDLANQTSGVECRKDFGVLDEIPQAYKDIDSVMKNQEEIIEIRYKLKQIVCIKG